MVNFDASPQLKLVKNWLDAYLTLDIKNIEPFISKSFQYQAFPETTDIPTEEREKHIEKYKEVLSALSKIEVSIQGSEDRLQARRLTPAIPRPHITK